MTLLHPLQCTAAEFSSRMHALCGRGSCQAVALYQRFIREGKLRDDLPEFLNAPQLYGEMVQSLDLRIDPVTQVCSDDQATKFLMHTHDGFSIESVIISMKGRKSLCLSSQIGCRMACAFCKTGQMGIKRNLALHEVVQQLFAARHILKSDIHNVVFMGMGEPFDNYDTVMEAVAILADPLSFGIGLRRITVSTSGDVAGIIRFTDEQKPGPNLAVSLGAPIDAIRSALMPRRRKEPLCELYKAMSAYCTKKQRQILISYVLLKDVNDDPSLADDLATYLKGLDVRVNIIPYNPFPESRFSRPSLNAIDGFVRRLRSHQLPVFLRQERGLSIQAACGQLGDKPRG
jgi:23S rRNA (adenine2503-C2)-methyltransferase